MRGLRSWSVLAVVCVLAVPAFAQHMYLKFENPSIKGGSTAAGHEGEIEVLHWSYGYARPDSPSRGGRDPGAGHQTVQFSKYVDLGSDDLMRHTWSGKPIGKVTLRCYLQEEGQPRLYLMVEMQNVYVANFQIEGGAAEILVEKIQLEYGAIKYTYLPLHGAPEEASAVRRLDQ